MGELRLLWGRKVYRLSLVVLQCLRLNTSANLFKRIECFCETLLGTKRCEETGVHVAHLRLQLSLDVDRRSVLNHDVHEGNGFSIKAV